MGIDELEYQYLAGQNGIYTGSLNEQRTRYYNSQAGTNYGNVNEAEVAFLRSKVSSTTKSVSDLWRAYLVSIGISESPSLDEMKIALWSGGGTPSSPWTDYRTITIDHTKVPSTLTNVAIPIVGDFPYLATVANNGGVTDANGYDIQFFSDIDLTTPLYFERASWANTGLGCQFWVNIPSLSHTVDTVIYMASGNATVTTDQQDKANTWPNYTSVWHLENLTDSKGGNDLTDSSTVASTVKVGNGRYIDTTGHYLSLGSAIACSGTYSLEFWAREINGGFGTNAKLFSKSGVTNKYIQLLPAYYFEVSTASGTSRYVGYGSGQADTIFTTLNHFTLTQDGSNLKLYRNGDLIQSLAANAGSIDIDRIGGFTTAGESFLGYIDEIRYANGVTETADYIRVVRYAQAYPHELYSISGANGAAIVTTNNFTNPNVLFGLESWIAGKSPSDVGNWVSGYDADTLTSLAEDATIDSWTDDSGTGNTVTQTDATKRPQIYHDQVNGHDAVWFRFYPYLKKTTPTSLPSGNANRFTMAVALDGDPYPYQTIYAYGSSAVNQAYALAFNNGTMFYWGYSNDITVDAGAQGYDTFHIYGTGYNGTNLVHFGDGTKKYDTANTLNTGSDRSTIGIYINEFNTYNLWGFITALHHFSAYPSAQDLADLNSYFALRYNSPIHPITLSERGGNISRNTNIKRTGYSASVKIIAISDVPFYETFVNGASKTTLTAYAYTDGTQVASTDCQLYYDGSVVTTSFGSPDSDGFCLLTATITGSDSLKKQGVYIKAGKTVYVSNFNVS